MNTSRGPRNAATMGLALLALVTAGWALATASPIRTGAHAGVAPIARPSLGLPAVLSPASGPSTPERVELGRLLFFDARLSAGDSLACASCHVPEEGFTQNGRPTRAVAEGRPLRRNAPSILNAAYETHLFHDGRASSLEDQVLVALLDAREMANRSLTDLEVEIAALPEYAALFQVAFAGSVTTRRIAQAIASFERTLLAGNSRFDRWQFGGEAGALTRQEQLGFALFTGKARCVSCHAIGDTDAMFTDRLFHDTGVGYLGDPDRPRAVPARAAVPDYGRQEATRDSSDRWRFKTLSLRNVAITAPYMHDGSLATLEDVVRFYLLGGVPHPGIDPLMGPIDLVPDEQAALVSFLKALTSEDLDALVRSARRAEPAK